jgi:hypothetical protein
MTKKRIHLNIDESLLKKLPVGTKSHYLEAALVLCHLGGLSLAIERIAQQYQNLETTDLNELTLEPQPPESWQEGWLQITPKSRQEQADNFAEDIIGILQICQNKQALATSLRKYYHNQIYSKLR